MKVIYNAILERLNKNNEDVGLNWVDLDKGQLRKTGNEQRPPLKYPAALISISIPTARTLAGNIQRCTASVTVRLVFDPNLSNRTSAGAPGEVRDKNLNPYDTIAKVYSLLQGFYTENFDPLDRTSQGEEQNDKLFVYRITFSTKFDDYTAE